MARSWYIEMPSGGVVLFSCRLKTILAVVAAGWIRPIIGNNIHLFQVVVCKILGAAVYNHTS